MMNLGPPPPPPPPPFATGTPPPARRPPAEIPTKPTPPIATPPAVLAGAMMKDRKPFTYTPGGINLAEIKSPRMQRRLQRNACMEGVRPSPLAQQPPPTSPGGISATLPPHGMIQVLPVPGMGMGPVVKPQPLKEPPKLKRKGCGPPPPPPPFAIGESSSVNASPFATPASATAITSVTPPTTPSTFSSPSSSLSSAPIENGTRNGWDSGHSGSDRSNLKPLMATEPGPSAPSPPPPPPPPPPPSSVTPKKRFSYPSSSSTSSSVSKPETESSLSPIPSPSASKSPISSTHTKTIEQRNDHNTHDADSAPSLSEKDEASPDRQLPSSDQETKIGLTDKTTAMSNDLTNHVNGESIPDVTPEDPKSVTTDSPRFCQKISPEESFSACDSRTTKMIIEQKEQNKDIKETDITDVQNVTESEKDKAIPNLTQDDVKIKVKETVVVDTNEEEINEKETTPAAANEEKVNDAVTEADEEKETVTEAKEEKVEEVKALITESKEEKVIEIKETVSEAEKENVKEVRETNEEKLKPETKLAEKDERNGSDVNNVAETSHKKYSEETSPTNQSISKSRSEAKSSLTSPVQTPNTPPIKDFSSKSATSKSTPITVNHEKDPACTFRPAVRMASPPAAVERETRALNHHDRFIRQASLPADPLSPSSGSKSVHKGSLYIPPVKHTSIDVNGTIKTPPFQNTNNSPTSSGLNKAPLPWMCGVKKEPSPPPEFLIHAQKTQERLQRQRSLTRKDSNRQQYSYDPQKNETAINSCPVYQNNCSPTVPYSPPTAVATSSNPPQVLKNTDLAPQHTWRSPAHQSNTLNHQKKPYEQQQQQQQQQRNLHQQQNSFAKPHSQSFNHHQRIPAASPSQATHSNSLPRERIIPIMLEASPPVTPTSKGPSFVVKSFVPTKANPPFHSNYQRQGSWPNLPSPIGTGGAFSPYESNDKYHSSSNALEALQQMQQNLAQLNSGLQTAYPRAIHQKLHLNLSPSHPLFSAQNPPQPNGTLHTNHSVGQEPTPQSRSFRVLQNAYDYHDSTGTPVQLQQDTPAEMKKYTGSSIPSRSFRMLQAMTDNDEGPGPGESDL